MSCPLRDGTWPRMQLFSSCAEVPPGFWILRELSSLPGIIGPNSYGSYAFALLLLAGIEQATDLGIRPAVIAANHDPSANLPSLRALQMLRGIFVGALLMALSTVLARPLLGSRGSCFFAIIALAPLFRGAESRPPPWPSGTKRLGAMPLPSSFLPPSAWHLASVWHGLSHLPTRWHGPRLRWQPLDSIYPSLCSLRSRGSGVSDGTPGSSPLCVAILHGC